MNLIGSLDDIERRIMKVIEITIEYRDKEISYPWPMPKGYVAVLKTKNGESFEISVEKSAKSLDPTSEDLAA